MICRDELKRAIAERDKWPTRDCLQKLVKGGFALHSPSAQMLCHAFLANVDTTTRLRKAGRNEMRYLYKDKTFYPLMWPKQVMCIKGNKVILPKGRGRASLVQDRPDWLTEKAACKLVWTRTGYGNAHHNRNAGRGKRRRRCPRHRRPWADPPMHGDNDYRKRLDRVRSRDPGGEAAGVEDARFAGGEDGVLQERLPSLQALAKDS